MKLKHNDPQTQSKDLTAENIDQLKKLFPNIVEEGKVNFDVLRQLLGDEVVSEQEYYRFTWPGKHMARQEALKSSTGTLRPAPKESVDWDSTQNLYIEGDNLEVLKLLQKSYFNKVKMIYIDPPYNTGKDFVYKDNYADNLAEYNEKFNRTDADGNVLSSDTNNEGNARYHSNWLNMMYPRLQLARTLLKDDGVIFISIDDNEVHNLRRICDEIFGEENFVASLIWSGGKKNDSKYVSVSHEYVLCYFKNKVIIEEFKVKWRTKKEGLKDIYKKVDEYIKKSNGNYSEATKLLKDWYRSLDDSHPSKKSKHYNNIDENGVYFADNISWPGGGGPKYEVLHPITNKPVKIPSRGWIFGSKERLNEFIDKGLVKFGADETSVPTLKSYLKDREYEVPYSVMYKDGRAATKRLMKLFGSKIFESPKDKEILNKFINLGTNNESIVLDFFSGSATTAHAVMDLNKEDILEGKEGNRKYIMVQLPEPTEEKSEAHKAGYKTIAEIGKERIRRAGKQIQEELKDQPEALEQLDLGFKVFKLDSSNIHTWETDPDKLENNLFRDQVIKDDRTAEDVLYEVLLKYGLDLTYPIEEVTLDGKKVYSVGAGQLIFCLEDGVTRDTAQAIINWANEDEIINPKVVFKDSGFTNDVEKTNVLQTFKTHGITDVKSI